MKQTLILFSALLINITIFCAQEHVVPSLRSLALDKAVQLLHSQLTKPQSPAQRNIILDHWQDKAGVLFNEPSQTADLYKPTIIERFEQKYATQLRKIAETNNDGSIIALTSDGTKCLNMNGYKSFELTDIVS